ncbi:MAG: hypothetical protein NTU54_04925, partial [Candidatus Omnitrophica bacterium]|nr:hypothetical protein [Candidatus Omnitrophota bacterium]
MKKLLICLVAAIAMSFIATKASIAASQATQTLTTGATVTDTAPVIDITLLKFDGITPNYDDPWANGAKQTNTSLDFGQL